MLENYYKKIYCKLNDNFESINIKLLEGHYKLVNESYILDIFMINERNFKKKINSIKEIDDYLIIRDYNNEFKEIILFNDGIFREKINNIISIKKIIEKLGYTELFYINQEKYIYQDKEAAYEIVNVHDLGVFLECNDTNNIISVNKKLKDLKITYDLDINNYNYVDIAFDKYIKGKNL